MIYDTISNLELNLIMLLDLIFLSDGHYKNITKGTTIRGIDASKLVIDSSAVSDFGGVSGCQVWQSPFQRWVYESGVALNNAPFISGLTPPIRVSGIYVNGSFFPQTSGAVSGYQYFIDYSNGRVIFAGTGIPSNSLVQASYAYKKWRVEFAENALAQEMVEAYGETALKDNSIGDTSIIYPSGDIRSHTFPCVYIDIKDGSSTALELGNRSLREKPIVELEIYSLNRWERNSAIELLKNRQGYNAPLVDFNYAPLPLSGLVNTLSPAYIPYQVLLTNPTYRGNSVISWGWYIEAANWFRLQKDGTFFRGQVVFDTIIENISPTGRGPANPYIG